MTDYQCQSCKRYFPQDEAERRPETITTEFWGSVATSTIGYTDTCPHCAGEDLAEVCLCADCGEFPAMEGYDHCQACDDAYRKLDEELQKPILTRTEKLSVIGQLHALFVDITLGQKAKS